MENTPLELYETAYRLHYVENRLPEAVGYYEALIKEFPDSNECGYAAIQIQKIKSNELAKILKQRAKALHPVAIIALVLGILSIVGIIAGSILYLYKSKIDHQRESLSLRAMCRMYAGDYDEALKLLAQAKILAREDIAPFDMSATIYRKRRQYEQAKAEYEIFYRLNPEHAPVETDISPIFDKSEPAGVSAGAPAQPETSASDTRALSKNETAVPNPIQIKELPAPSPRVSKVKKPAAPKSTREKTRIVSPDSVSYF